MILAAAVASAAKQPHLFLVVSDDHGWNDIGIRNPKILTPKMDAMIKEEGVLFDRHYVSQ